MTVLMDHWVALLTLLVTLLVGVCATLSFNLRSGGVWCGVVWYVIRSPGYLLYNFPLELKPRRE